MRSRLPKRVKLSPSEVHAVRVSYLAEPVTFGALAEKYRVHQSVIRDALTGPEMDKLRDELHGAMTRQARDILHKAADKAATTWSDTILDKAAERGDHRPARDLLAAIQAIEIAPREKTPHVTVQIGFALQDLTIANPPALPPVDSDPGEE